MNTDLSKISVESLKGVGHKVAEKLSTLSISSLEDLLFHLPSRYQDRSRIHPIGSLLHGQTVQIFGIVEAADIVFGKRRSLVCKVSDASGILDIRLFYFSMAQKKQFVRGSYIQCYGQVSYSGRTVSMIHPEIKFLGNQDEPVLSEGLIAIYPTTQGLNQKTFQRLVNQALAYLDNSDVEEILPRKILQQLNFLPLKSALKMLHCPPLDISITDLQNGGHPLIQRLAFEELLAQNLALKRLKQKHQIFESFPINVPSSQILAFKNALPFKLTCAQERVSGEIENDLIKNSPMMRLVQGDVGCGKTLVAAIAILKVATNNFQSVLMAPTELLAEQHFVTFNGLFEKIGIKVSLLVSKMNAKQKNSFLSDIASGDSLVVIGTHAVFQRQVEFKELALVVIDEQHRFGVQQRKQLLDKSQNDSVIDRKPHQLIMTATPIPRTLAQTTYADLDLSIIDELPPGRKPVDTSVVNDLKRDQVIQRIRQACQKDKRQVYWVCTLIEESEELECQAAEATYQDLHSQLAELKIGLVHGRLKSAEKNALMSEFKMGNLDILIATTVIEVGVDVPNASLMIIENPERLGLSQLHQLRGRVGRGKQQSYCLLMYRAPLSLNAKRRLEIMRETCDGFKIAEKDLEIRGAGEVLGTRQTGDTIFRFADIIRDKNLLPIVNSNAEKMIIEFPDSIEKLSRRWIKDGSQLSHV